MDERRGLNICVNNSEVVCMNLPPISSLMRHSRPEERGQCERCLFVRRISGISKSETPRPYEKCNRLKRTQLTISDFYQSLAQKKAAFVRLFCLFLQLCNFEDEKKNRVKPRYAPKSGSNAFRWLQNLGGDNSA